MSGFSGLLFFEGFGRFVSWGLVRAFMGAFILVRVRINGPGGLGWWRFSWGSREGEGGGGSRGSSSLGWRWAIVELEHGGHDGSLEILHLTGECI